MGFDVSNMDGFVAAACAAADVAGAVIRPWFRAGVAAELKGDASPVTVADRAAEQAMRAVLSGRYPEHGVLGEEFGLERGEARYRWVLDPIDGTRAFITGRPVFGTLVALLEDGVPVVGVIDQPISGERWVGVRGRRTVFSGGAGAVGCRALESLAEAELSCTAPEIFSDRESDRWGRLAGVVRRVSWGGDCYAYGLVALGAIDVVAEAGLKVWDWAALVPVIEGAGGSVTDWAGEALRAEGDGTVLAVGAPGLVGAAVDLLSGARGGRIGFGLGGRSVCSAIMEQMPQEECPLTAQILTTSGETGRGGNDGRFAASAGRVCCPPPSSQR